MKSVDYCFRSVSSYSLLVITMVIICCFGHTHLSCHSCLPRSISFVFVGWESEKGALALNLPIKPGLELTLIYGEKKKMRQRMNTTGG